MASLPAVVLLAVHLEDRQFGPLHDTAPHSNWEVGPGGGEGGSSATIIQQDVQTAAGI